MAEHVYDVIIIGGGPAGLTAGLYLQRARVDNVLIEQGLAGGQAMLTERIANYPGFPAGITGPELMERMKKQALDLGLNIITDEISALGAEREKDKNIFVLTASSGKDYKARSVILATGAIWRHLGVPGEDRFHGKGVSYCATCDGPFFKGKKVIVVGGGDKAVEEAIYLTRFASSITLVHRRNELRAAKILQEELKRHDKISLCLDSVVSSIDGEKKVEKVKVKNVKDDAEKNIECDGVFIFIGIIPNSGIVKKLVETDENGYVITDNDMHSSAGGIFACGDVRKKTLQQIVVATGEGAQAAVGAQIYLAKIK